MARNKTVLCLMAHPDDAEILSGGTLALLAQQGWDVVIATMTPGQAGSTTLGPDEISTVRRQEAADAAALLGGNYRCVESEDVFILYDKPTLQNVIVLFRQVNPALVITASPTDYMLDHEITSQLAQTACMAATIPNIRIEGTAPIQQVPHLYYADAIQGKDRLGQSIAANILIDISSVMPLKEAMLCCHKSQRAWLQKISGVDEYVIMMKEFSAQNGARVGCEYAEGYRQHLGFSYPQDDLLKNELAEWTHERR
ncbi:PIG-L deacetylase family protein [Parapedobacter defluvii]|nr:PIG-L family deacetylase [Parapedobacter defluvii]